MGYETVMSPNQGHLIYNDYQVDYLTPNLQWLPKDT